MDKGKVLIHFEENETLAGSALQVWEGESWP